MNNVYLQEAFKALDMLNEEDFNLGSTEDIKDLENFVETEPKEFSSIDIIDTEAKTEEDLQDNYIGNAILDCCVCHSKLYKDPDDIEVDEETGLVNVEEECPFCLSLDGYKIIGQVAPYKEVENDDIEIEVDEESEDTASEEDSNLDESFDDINNSLNEDASFDYQMLGRLKSDCEYVLNTVKNSRKEYPNQFRNDNRQEDIEHGLWAKDIDKHIDYMLELYDKLQDKPDWITREQILDYKTRLHDYVNNVDESFKRNKKLREADWNLNRTNKLNNQERYVVVVTKSERPEMLNRIIGTFNTLDAAKEYQKGVYENSHFPDEVYEIKKQVLSYQDVNESLNKRRHKKVHIKNEDFKKVSIETDYQTMEMYSDENGKTTVTTEPRYEEEYVEDEMVTPVSDEMRDQINSKLSPDEVDIDIDEVSEDEFNELGESYLKKVYENVDSFKMSAVKLLENKLLIEGIIKFNSGKSKKTSFIFEGKDITKKKSVRFVGENLQLSRGKKAFTLKGTINKGKFIAESLNYNYRTKDFKGNSTRVYGTVRI